MTHRSYGSVSALIDSNLMSIFSVSAGLVISKGDEDHYKRRKNRETVDRFDRDVRLFQELRETGSLSILVL